MCKKPGIQKPASKNIYISILMPISDCLNNPIILFTNPKRSEFFKAPQMNLGGSGFLHKRATRWRVFKPAVETWFSCWPLKKTIKSFPILAKITLFAKMDDHQ
jgi:hypothetical protein